MKMRNRKRAVIDLSSRGTQNVRTCAKATRTAVSEVINRARCLDTLNHARVGLTEGKRHARKVVFAWMDLNGYLRVQLVRVTLSAYAFFGLFLKNSA